MMRLTPLAAEPYYFSWSRLMSRQGKRLFCEFFSSIGYFVLKFIVKVNFTKIII
jgi:hypothetical protein